MTTAETDNGKASEQSSEARAIARADDHKARAAMMRAFGGSSAALAWSEDGKRLLDIEVSMGGGKSRPMRGFEPENLAREGIVPGAEGWCWAPSAPRDIAVAEIRHTDACKSAGLPRGENCECQGYPVASAGAPPSWLTAAVLAALPPDGTPIAFPAIVANAKPVDRGVANADDVLAALRGLVADGEVECIEGGMYRRWGVPEGWAFSDDPEEPGTWRLLPIGCDHESDRQVATGYDNGIWRVYATTPKTPLLASAQDPSMPHAKRAALRACWERGVFSPAPGIAGARVRTVRDALIGGLAMGSDPIADVTPAPHFEAPPADRPAAIRAALLAVLQRGPVNGGASRVLLALDAEGTRDVTIAEARAAAREVGAVVDGARWSLPAMPLGWGWTPFDAIGQSHLAPTGCSDHILGAVASLDLCHGSEGMQWSSREEPWTSCKSVEEGQSAALEAARRAGLFARPAGVEVTGDGGPPVLPAVTSQSGEAVVYPAPHGPLDAAVLAILATASCAEITAHLKAWGATLVAEARGADPRLSEARDLLEAECTVTARAIAATAEARRERDDARTQMAIEAARADAAEADARRAKREASELAAAIHELAARREETERAHATLLAQLGDLHARWATAARGGGQ